MHKDFHARCDNKGPTISLFKIKDGDCIGGFTKAQWQSIEDEDLNLYDIHHCEDSDSFLFNLSCSRKFLSLKNEGGISPYAAFGPNFKSQNCYHNELVTWEPFNGDKTCLSKTNCPGFGIGIEGGKNMLTN